MSPGARVWVTGATGGIGRAIAARLAREGFDLLLFDLAAEPLAALAEELDAESAVCDLRDAAAVEAACGRLIASSGPPAALVNNAGLAMHPTEVEEVSIDLWQRLIEVNLTAPFVMTRAVLPAMRARRAGRIVSIASSSAIRVSPGQSAYIASKAGLLAFTKAVAIEYAPHGMTANVVCPGVVVTPMTADVFGGEEAVREAARSGPIANPMHEPVEPDDVAASVAFLLGPDADRITGQAIHCNAGSFMP